MPYSQRVCSEEFRNSFRLTPRSNVSTALDPSSEQESSFPLVWTDDSSWSKLIKPVSGPLEQYCADLQDSACHHLSIMVLRNEHRRFNMLWTIFVVLLILWLLGFSLHVGGGLIHLLLVVGLVVLVINLLGGRRSSV